MVNDKLTTTDRGPARVPAIIVGDERFNGGSPGALGAHAMGLARPSSCSLGANWVPSFVDTPTAKPLEASEHAQSSVPRVARHCT